MQVSIYELYKRRYEISDLISLKDIHRIWKIESNKIKDSASNNEVFRVLFPIYHLLRDWGLSCIELDLITHKDMANWHISLLEEYHTLKWSNELLVLNQHIIKRHPTYMLIELHKELAKGWMPEPEKWNRVLYELSSRGPYMYDSIYNAIIASTPYKLASGYPYPVSITAYLNNSYPKLDNPLKKALDSIYATKLDNRNNLIDKLYEYITSIYYPTGFLTVSAKFVLSEIFFAISTIIVILFLFFCLFCIIAFVFQVNR